MKQMYFMGVDISKEKIDIALITSDFAVQLEKVVKNNDRSIETLIHYVLKKFKLQQNDLLVCCEETGIYNKPLYRVCGVNQIDLWAENAFKIKKATTDFRGKSDKKDALRIAEYAARYEDKKRLYVAQDSDSMSLQTLLNARETLLLQINQLNQQLNESKQFDKQKYELLKECFDKPIKALKKQLAEIVSKINALVTKNEEYKQNLELLKSIPGIGEQTALQFIVYTRNFSAFESVKQLACYAGVAPFPNESGKIVKKARVSSFANKKLKKLLHMAAMAAIKVKGEIKQYYIRKVSEGKSKMLVLNNVRNKLVERMFIVIKRGTPYVSINLETILAN